MVHFYKFELLREEEIIIMKIYEDLIQSKNNLSYKKQYYILLIFKKIKEKKNNYLLIK